MLDQLIPLLLQGAGGALLGPILSALTGGKGLGTFGNALLGVLGGIGAGHGADLVGLDVGAMLGGGDVMRMIAEFLKGGVGGGVLGMILGLVRR